MGMDADVIAIGPFSDDIAGLLDYPAVFYNGTNPGTTVITTVFGAQSSNMSKLLAEAMNVDPWDFNTHKIDPGNINLDKLVEFVELEGYQRTDIDKFIKLVEKGFVFYYRPNG